MARRDEDDDDDDRPRRKSGRSKKSGGGMSTGTILLMVGGVALGVMVVCGGILALLMIPAVGAAREAARRSQSKNNLKQIGLALHNYLDTYNSFPPGSIVREDGVVSLSWQASILPYLDQAPLYQQIQMGEDWNGLENMKVRTTRVVTYFDPSVSEVTAPDGLPASHYAGSSQIFSPNKGLQIRNITDGLSNTILVGEVTTGIKSWGDPTNLRDPAAGIGATPQQFGVRGSGETAGAQFLLGDGAARFISQSVDPEIMKALATPDGGEQVGDY